jgi:hypothetical protein
MTRISDWLYRISTGWVSLVALGVFLIFTILVLPRQTASAEQNNAGAGTPDLSFYYSSAELYRMAEAYGEQGRQAYLQARWTFDLLWPIVYAAFLSTAISWLFKPRLPLGSKWRIANLVPLIGMLFDYLENISTSLVMLRYPQPCPVGAVFAPIFTPLKWISVGGSFILLLIGIAARLLKWINNLRV